MTDNDPSEDSLYSDPDLVQFYDIENEGGVDFDFCLRFAGSAASVLDLGCGTGQLAAALSKGRAVVGVDPATAMLAIAAQRAGGGHVEWIVGDARSIRLERRFDLVLLTGHAFQVFLTEPDRKAVLETIRHHLAPGGRFIFDSRNPLAREWLEWTPDQSQRVVDHPRLGLVRAWNDAVCDDSTGIVTYQTFYAVDGRDAVLSAASQIAFPSQQSLAALLGATGLAVDQWLGDWSGREWTPTSPEIIPTGRLR